jgi:hypothetical protein
MYLQMLQKQVEFSLPLILEKLRIDLRDSQKDLTDIGGPLPTTEKDQVRVTTFLSQYSPIH